MPYLSFQRSSTPMPYSFGKPTLNCCGGSLSTLGYMKRPDAASAAAHAAEKAPHDSPIHARRVKSGEVSSGSRPVATAVAGLAVAARAAAAPPDDATLVVLPARSGIGTAGGRGAGAGLAFGIGAAPVAAAADAVAASATPGGVGVTCGVAAGFAPGAESADHDVGNRILILILPDIALHRSLNVRAIEHLAEHRNGVATSLSGERGRGVPAYVGRRILERGAERLQLCVAGKSAEGIHDDLSNTRIGRGVQRRQSGNNRGIARCAKRPDRTDVRLGHLGRPAVDAGPRIRGPRRFGIVERLEQHVDRIVRQRRIEAADGQRQVLANPRIAGFRLVERFDQFDCDRPIGADFRVFHQRRQLERGRPLAVRAAEPDFGDVVARAPRVGHQRTEAEIQQHRDANDSQRDQKKLNSKGGRRGERISSCGFALDEFFHVQGNDVASEMTEYPASFTT